MVIRKADANTEANVTPDPKLFEAMGAYMGEMAKAGVLLAGEGLRDSSYGARVSFRDGVPTVVDGPFAETKELVAGFNIIEVKSKEEAIEWVKRWPRLDGDVELEIRQVHEPEDFGDALSPELRESEEKMRAESGWGRQ
jgi:hypothetical protein